MNEEQSSSCQGAKESFSLASNHIEKERGKKHLGVSENSAFNSPQAEKTSSLPQIPTPGIHHLRKGSSVSPSATAGGRGYGWGRGYGSRTGAGALSWSSVRRPAALGGLGCLPRRPAPTGAPPHTSYLLPRSPASRSPDAASESSGTFCWVSGRELSRRRVVRTARPLCARPLARPGGPAELPTCPPAGPGVRAPPPRRPRRTRGLRPQPKPEADGVMRHLPYFCRGQGCGSAAARSSWASHR